MAIKRSSIILVLAGGMAYLCLTSSKVGPAHDHGGIFTASPISSGSCSNCHNGGSGTTTLSDLQLTDLTSGLVVTNSRYVPGRSYAVRISGVSSTAASFSHFGFQCQASTAANKQAGRFSPEASAPGIDTVTINNASTGGPIQIIEHITPLAKKANGSFEANFKWTAPAKGTGNVSFHAIINAVDFTGTSSNDMPSAPFTKTLMEGSLAVTGSSFNSDLRIYPLPFTDVLHIQSTDIGPCEISVYNATGQEVARRSVQHLRNGTTELLSTRAWAAGTYNLCIRSNGLKKVMQVTKL